MLERIVRFFQEIANNPVDTRRRGAHARAASWKMRALALGFLAGVATSLALGLYDWRSRGSSVGGG